MIIGLRVQDDGSIMIWGETDGPDRGHLLNEVAKGGSLCGLPYEELIQYAWIETAPDGSLKGGAKRQPPDPSRPADIPDFLRNPRKDTP
jgi:hypothetical protein